MILALRLQLAQSLNHALTGWKFMVSPWKLHTGHTDGGFDIAHFTGWYSTRQLPESTLEYFRPRLLWVIGWT